MTCPHHHLEQGQPKDIFLDGFAQEIDGQWVTFALHERPKGTRQVPVVTICQDCGASFQVVRALDEGDR